MLWFIFLIWPYFGIRAKCEAEADILEKSYDSYNYFYY